MKIIERDDESHIDEEPSKEDRELGDRIAYAIGDTFIDFTQIAPTTQWATIVHALRFHGLKITEDK